MLRAEMHTENAEMQTKSVKGRKSTNPAKNLGGEWFQNLKS